jgi:hypothetical protein
MFGQIVRTDDVALGSSTKRTDIRSNEVMYVEIVPADLVRIVTEAIRRDHLSPSQVALVMDAAAEAALRRERRSNCARH